MTMPLRSDDLDPVTLRRYFPAQVELPDGTKHGNLLVLVTRVRVYVFDEPSLPLFDAPYDPAASSPIPAELARHQPAVFALPSIPAGGATGGAVIVYRERGCGCHHPLKAYQPWLPSRSAAR